MTTGVRLDRLQLGFKIAMDAMPSSVAARRVWAHQQHPRDADDLLTMALTAGPSEGKRSGAHYDRVLKPPDTVLVRILSATVGNRPWFDLNHFEHFYDVQAGDTVTTIRDALIASINANHAGEMVATANDPDEILLTADYFGALWHMTTYGPDLLVGTGVFSGNAVTVTTGREDGQLTITGYSKGRELRNGARAIVTRAFAELRKRSTIHTLDRYGIALGQRGPIVPLDAIAGGSWETQAAITVDLGITSWIVAPTDLIETVRFNYSIRDAGGANPFTQSVVATAP